jgi:nitronate monooxygenase
MTQSEITNVLDFYNMLLEAERAGVTVLSDLLYRTEDQRLRDCLKKFLRDEGMNCHILASLIFDLDAKPTDKTGAFVEKVQALNTMAEKMDLLIRGQSWVARKIHEFGHLLPEGSQNLFLEAIKVQHEENVNTLKGFLDG